MHRGFDAFQKASSVYVAESIEALQPPYAAMLCGLHEVHIQIPRLGILPLYALLMVGL
jgi:hypothetical protein